MRVQGFLVAEWILLTLFGIIVPTKKKRESVHFGRLMNSATKAEGVSFTGRALDRRFRVLGSPGLSGAREDARV